jgi:hypothetical protein
MPARVESFPVPHSPLRRVLKPALVSAALAAVAMLIRKYTREPALPKMSDDWLRSHRVDFTRDEY